MKYLHLYKNQESFENVYYNDEKYYEPFVSLTQGDGNNRVDYNKGPRDYSLEYYTIELTKDVEYDNENEEWIYPPRQMSFENQNFNGKTVKYRINYGEWVTETISTDNPIVFPANHSGDTIEISLVSSGISNYADSEYRKGFTIPRTRKIYGNTMSLIYGDDFIDKKSFPSNTQYNWSCFWQEDDEITGYEFENLVFPATALTPHCYELMFDSCFNLEVIPKIASPKVLSEYCCYRMFEGCIKLTTAFDLPATTLVLYCYCEMFKDCTSLNYVKCLATDISADYCTDDWLDNVASTGTFVKNPNMNNWESGVYYGIPTNWTVQDA